MFAIVEFRSLPPQVVVRVAAPGVAVEPGSAEEEGDDHQRLCHGTDTHIFLRPERVDGGGGGGDYGKGGKLMTEETADSMGNVAVMSEREKMETWLRRGPPAPLPI